MIIELKKELLKSPEKIKNILEFYEFYNINISSSEIRCGRDSKGNPTSIRIRLKDNDDLFVEDFAKNITYDLIVFIMKSKEVKYIDVLNIIKKELNISDWYTFENCSLKSPFGGYYDKFKTTKTKNINNIYDENILKQYEPYGNLKFLKDHISLEIQKEFNIMFDVISQRIIIPIYDCYGNIIGIKGRANWEVQDGELKYLYLIPCYKGSTLYGYHQNYKYLYNNTIIIGEAEKFVLQACSYGIRNVVGLGGNSLTSEQCKLILSLYPTKIIFAYDEGLDIEIIKTNILKLKSYIKFMNIDVVFWDYSKSKYIEKGSKMSMTDKGKDIFEKILSEEVA